MVDSHCHLNFHKFATDVADVVARAHEASVTTIVNVGTSIESSRDAIELAERFDSCLAVVGIHPHHADKVTLQSHPVLDTGSKIPDQVGNDNLNWLSQLEAMLDHPKVIGIGEIGMDFFSYQSNGIVDPATQEDVFRKQLELSIEHKLPLQIHNRQAGKDVLRILSDYRNELQNLPGVFHCFAGDKEILESALDMGFYIGYDGNSTYPGLAPGEATSLVDLIEQTPMDRILVETDSPYLTPIPLRGTRNEPKNVILVGDFIAKIKGLTRTEVEQQTSHNFSTLFGVQL